jgi:hypothetical protein
MATAANKQVKEGFIGASLRLYHLSDARRAIIMMGPVRRSALNGFIRATQFRLQKTATLDSI